MKRIGLVLFAAAFVFGSGFLKQNEDGSLSADTSGLIKKADETAKQAEAMATNAVEQAKKVAESYNVKKEEIIADLEKPVEAIKQKVAGMDAAKLVAYLNQYSNVFSDTQNQVTDYTAQLKELKWTQKLGAKGKELKSQISQYTGQLKGLKEQCSLYIDKLESYGVDPSAYGIDLSAYGL
ncbi:MAG: hypothetical protein ABFR47_06885 [Verrucomicrobiota bacterium]